MPVVARLAAIAAAGLIATHAAAVSVSLGASAQNLTLYGQGAVAPGVGGFTVGQGTSSFDGVTSTFTFTGAITGGDAGYNSGTYRFVTTYAGPNTPEAGPAAPVAQSNPNNVNFFYYDFIDPTTNVTLFLKTPGHNYTIPLVTAGNFVAGTGYGFTFTNATCTGVAACTQNNVGLTPGATIFGPVTIGASFTGATPTPGVPEPTAWALLVAGFGGVGLAARRRRAVAVAA